MDSVNATAESFKRIGNELRARGDVPGALASYRRSLEIAPDNLPALYNAAVCLIELGRSDEAEREFRRLIELDPTDAEGLLQLGLLFFGQSRFREAITVLRQATDHAPQNALLWLRLGMSYGCCDETLDAAACLRKAIELEPDYLDAHFNLGNVHVLLAQHADAARCYAFALAAKPNEFLYGDALLFAMQHIGDWTRFAELVELRRQASATVSDRPIPPFHVLSTSSDRAEQLCAARSHARDVMRSVGGTITPRATDPRPHRRIRLGYLSADFHGHATGYLTAELFELHDRERFEVCAYSYGPDDASAMRKRLRQAFDVFRDIAHDSPAAAAAAICADKIDILVDLKGFTQGARSEILALRPVPIQVSYLGYPGTMGASFIDYLVADRFVVPPEHAGDYSEQVIYMPASYQVNDRKRRIGHTPARGELGLPDGAFVFCCFNQGYKILPEVFALWMRILAAVSGSVLWLLAWNPSLVQNLRREAEAHGIDPNRLIFAPSAPLEQHLGRLRAADLFLDTYPCTAHTTGSDALWTGVPVLTRAGATFASRVAGSLLHAVGLPELITASFAEYEGLAVRLAGDDSEMRRLREKLQESRTSAPLFDTPAFVRALEGKYELMRGMA